MDRMETSGIDEIQFNKDNKAGYRFDKKES